MQPVRQEGKSGGLRSWPALLLNLKYSPDPARSFAAPREDCLCSAQHAVANVLLVTDRNIPIATARGSCAPLLLHIVSCRWNEAQLLPGYLTVADEWQWRTTTPTTTTTTTTVTTSTTTTTSNTALLTGLRASSPLNRTRRCGGWF